MLTDVSVGEGRSERVRRVLTVSSSSSFCNSEKDDEKVGGGGDEWL